MLELTICIVATPLVQLHSNGHLNTNEIHSLLYLVRPIDIILGRLDNNNIYNRYVRRAAGVIYITMDP